VRADLYSTGVVLYECLTARRPVESDSVVTLIARLLAEDPVPPSAVNPAVPAEVSEIVMRLLARDRDHRPPSAVVLHEMLAGVEA
jgi:serine/threonine-protein kinase